MSVLAAVLAQLLHLALIVAAAPMVAGALGTIEARLDGRQGPHVLQAWRDLRRLMRKQAVMAEAASPLGRFAPIAGLAVTVTAAALVPSFTLGMAFAPIGDLLVLAGLFGVVRAIRALAAMDAGTMQGGILAERGMRLALGGEPAVLLAVFTLALLAGSSNLDAIARLQRDGLMQPGAAAALSAAALVGVALIRHREEVHAELAGSALAVTRLSDAFGILVWVDLLSALFLPFGIAEPGAGPASWLIGLVAWIVKLAVLVGIFAVCRRMIGHPRPRAAAALVAVSTLFGLLAAVFALTSVAAA